jgi:hypothetical protein
MATFNENNFWKQFEIAPIGTIFRHPRDGYIMKTGTGTRRSGWSQQDLYTQFAKELNKRWTPTTLR